MAEITELPPIGTPLRIIGDSGEGHGCTVGMIVTANKHYDVGKLYIDTPDKRKPYVCFKSVSLCTRKDSADFCRVRANADIAAGNLLLQSGAAMLTKAEMLEKYNTDEEEISDLLIEVMDSKGARAERVSKMMSLLSGRLKLSV